MILLRSKPWFATALAALLSFQQGLFDAQAAETTAPVRTPAPASVPVLALPAFEVSSALSSPLPGSATIPELELAPDGIAPSPATSAAPAQVAAPGAKAAWPVQTGLASAARGAWRWAIRSHRRGKDFEDSRLFDGSKPPEDDGSPRVYLRREDGRVAQTTVKGLDAALKRDPAFADRLNAKGLVRLVVAAKDGGTLKRADAPAVGASLAAQGLTAPLDVEKLGLKPQRAGKTGAPAAGKAGRLWSELTYLPRAFAAALDKPTRSELLGGLASKGPAFALSAVWWIAKLWPSVPLEPKMKELPALIHHVLMSPWHAPAHPAALAAVLALSLALETFHGIWIATWQNFQNIIAKQRGTAYQTVFNLSYMQSTGALFRFITWTAVAGTIAPWTLHYWRDMGLVTLVGTFIGTLGYQGLNEFYNKGSIKRWLRSLVQQGRDLFFLLGGVFFASGSMGVYWPLFLTAQGLDLGLNLFSRLARPRPSAYVAEPAVASAPEFSATYPVSGAQRPTVRQALSALVHTPLVQVASWPVRAAWRKLIGLLRGSRR